MKKILSAICLTLAFVCLGVALSARNAYAAATTSAKSAIVMEQRSHRILFVKNADERLPMASTTKIATALTVLNNAQLDSVVTVPAAAVGIEGSSIYLREGERLTVRELLYGLMLRSGNDCAVALALHVAGSVEAFAQMMNDMAADVGCTDTHFVNPHGLHDPEHYTTAADLALITCAALDNSDFREIASCKSMRISNEGMEYDRLLVNKNKLLTNCAGADGVKTGYTKKAGRCLVGSATRNGMQVVSVVLDCGPMFEETARLFDAAFGEFSMQTIVPCNKMCGSVVEGDVRKYYCCPQGFAYPLRSGEQPVARADLQRKLCVVELDGEQIFSCPLTVRYVQPA